jgi:16S rRNA processing protein RimM
MAEPEKRSPRHPAKAKQSRPAQQAGEVYTHRNRTVFIPDGYLAVGYINSVHGLKGEVRVELYTDFPQRFAPGVTLLLGEDLEEVTVVGARPHKNGLLLQLEGIEGREQAEALRGSWLFVAEEDAVELDEDAYWVHDIIGLMVQTEEGEQLGTIREVLFTGANEVYVVEPIGLVNGGKELLLPAIDEVVREINLPANRMIVHLLPGLLAE